MSEIRCCFVGDSLTLGVGDNERLGWVGRLAKANAHKQKTIYNLGIRSNTGRDLQNRWLAETTARLPSSLEGRIAFAFGSNDAAIGGNGNVRVPLEDSVACGVSMMLACRDQGRKPLWIGPAAIGERDVKFAPFGDAVFNFRREEIARYDAAFADKASSIGIPYVSLFTALRDDPDFCDALSQGDGLHPVARGYDLMARVLSENQVFADWFDVNSDQTIREAAQ